MTREETDTLAALVELERHANLRIAMMARAERQKIEREVEARRKYLPDLLPAMVVSTVTRSVMADLARMLWQNALEVCGACDGHGFRTPAGVCEDSECQRCKGWGFAVPEQLAGPVRRGGARGER